MGRSGAQYAQLNVAQTWTALQQFNSNLFLGGERLRNVAKTTNYTAFTSDLVILVNATGGAVTIQLPLSSVVGETWVVKKTDASANAVTVQGTSGTIDGAATFVLAAQNNAVMVMSDGINGFALAKV